ncbi:MAG: helix-turn-helix domain-containing protein [Prevotella sp.]|jgi:transcriptional regulator with XRE-family HTH domain|nr:helix-turn-helix domain-containing protein [Prevotella sp.]
MGLAENVRATREAIHMKQSELAKRTNLSPSHLSDIERGKKRPSPKNIALLANVLGYSEAELVYGEDLLKRIDSQSAGRVEVDSDSAEFNSSRVALLYEYIRDNARSGSIAELEIAEKYLELALGAIQRAKGSQNLPVQRQGLGVAG